MVNGKPGDHPYTDLVSHGFDLGEPEIAARLREIDAKVDLETGLLLMDLVAGFHFKPEGLSDYDRQRLLGHLDTIERLWARRPGQRRKTKSKSKTKKKKKAKTKKKKKRAKKARR